MQKFTTLHVFLNCYSHSIFFVFAKLFFNKILTLICFICACYDAKTYNQCQKNNRLDVRLNQKISMISHLAFLCTLHFSVSNPVLLSYPWFYFLSGPFLVTGLLCFPSFLPPTRQCQNFTWYALSFPFFCFALFILLYSQTLLSFKIHTRCCNHASIPSSSFYLYLVHDITLNVLLPLPFSSFAILFLIYSFFYLFLFVAELK